MRVDAYCEGKCDRCGEQRKGVRFSHELSVAFLCWEHFGPVAAVLAELLRRALIRPVCSPLDRCTCHTDHCAHCRERLRVAERRRSWSCSCPCCRGTWNESRSRSSGISMTESHGEAVSHSQALSQTISHGESHGPFA
jgi:hypothetical protein